MVVQRGPICTHTASRSRSESVYVTLTWLEAAVQSCMHRPASVSAPAGFAYQGHSIRSLGASAMAVIGVPRHIYIWLGGWARSSSSRQQCGRRVLRAYVDPTFQPSPAAFALYGWALSHQYAAGADVAEIAVPLPDPDLMRPAPTARESPSQRAAAAALGGGARAPRRVLDFGIRVCGPGTSRYDPAKTILHTRGCATTMSCTRGSLIIELYI
jgi:hypothetical protein